MANHLIIGLGGTGGKIIRELRKRVYEEFHSNEPNNGVFINYVYVDSSPADLNDTTGWSVLGKSVHLGSAQKVNINGISMNVLNNINMYPGLKGFLSPSDITMMKEEMGGLISTGIGGQRRRLGRTLIANNIGDKQNISNFEHAIHSAVGKLQQESGDSDVTFHICAGLAGGTGSGSIIDAIAQIRTWFPYQQTTKAFKMRLFLYTPEKTLVNVKHDAGFYQANGYSALLELNALSIGKYHPTDVTGKKDIFTGEINRLLNGQEAFEAAYLYSNVNEDGKILNLGKELPAAVADFIYQTTVASATENNQLNRLSNCENDGAEPEKDQAGERAHSRKFMTFGISRIQFPETEIREYITYAYSLQAARQLTYNMWQDGIGYGERTIDEVGLGFVDEIKDKQNRETLCLSNNHLTLAKPIIETPATKRWRIFEETWENRTQAEANDIIASVDKDQWLSAFSAKCEDFFNNSFRQHGVAGFYKNQQQERKGYAHTIRRQIEKKLFEEWAGGGEKSKSILEIEKYTKLLIDDCQSRTAAFDEQRARIEGEMEKFSQEISLCNKEWGNIGTLGKFLFKKREEVFARYRVAKCNYYSAATRAIAYTYAKELLFDVIEELQRMLQGIIAFKNEINAINEEVLNQMSSKCSIHEEQSDQNIKKYNPEIVHSVCKQFVTDKDKMQATAATIRSRMVTNLGEDGERTFANLYDKTDYEAAINLILEVCQENAVADMESAAKNDPLNKMVGVNILEKLRNELNTDEKLEQFVKAVKKASRAYVQFDPQETAMTLEHTTGAMMPLTQIVLPEAKDDSTAAFRKKLISAFAIEQAGFSPTDDVAVSPKDNEIIVISAYSGFPIRFLSNVKTAKERYDALTTPQNAKAALNTMVLHTETFTKELPSIYEEDKETTKRKIAKPLMMAYILNIIQQQQNPVTQAKFDALRIPNELFGFDWKPLGKNFAETWELLAQDAMLRKSLEEQVNKELAAQAVSNSQKLELKKALGQFVQTTILASPLCENNQFSQNYTMFKNWAIEIMNNELKEL